MTALARVRGRPAPQMRVIRRPGPFAAALAALLLAACESTPSGVPADRADVVRSERLVIGNVTRIGDGIQGYFRETGVTILREGKFGTVEARSNGVNATGWVACQGLELSQVPVDMRVHVEWGRGQISSRRRVVVHTWFASDGVPLRRCRSTGAFEAGLFRSIGASA